MFKRVGLRVKLVVIGAAYFIISVAAFAHRAGCQ